MANPKHKIFFGFPGNESGKTSKSASDITGSIPYKEAQWSWDTSAKVFSSSALKFDADFDLGTLTDN